MGLGDTRVLKALDSADMTKIHTAQAQVDHWPEEEEGWVHSYLRVHRRR